MKSLLTFLCLFCLATISSAQLTTPFEGDPEQNTSATYQEVINFYQELEELYPERFQLRTYGMTDSGFPLDVAVLSNDGTFDPEQLRIKGRTIVFVNNGIHAGEPCGVDASMLLLRDYLEKPEEYPFPNTVSLVVIPFYNIGGALNRGSHSRTNQQGPEAHGFRGNARNLDLNRDFIKCDSRNAQTFNELFNEWNPHIFIDNHTSNGADYQYTLTLIPTQHNKLMEPLASYLQDRMLPYLYEDMASRGWEMTPYVFARDIPDNGIAGFLDLPRYSSGYAALHRALSFIPETHMLKPFGDRVMSVYHFMQAVIGLADADNTTILSNYSDAGRQVATADSMDLNWALDFSQADTLQFKGFEASYRPSDISGQDRLYYDREAPFIKPVPHYNYYQPTETVAVPPAYIIPQAYQEVIELLRWNGVKIHTLIADHTLQVEQYYIRDYETVSQPYEGHYLHSQVDVEVVEREWLFREGDYVIHTSQTAAPYIVHTLEPQAADSYFAWNFFDACLQQKEYFSSYVFEDLALQYLKADPELAEALDNAKAADEDLANSARAQLDFIYKRSPHYEVTHNLYPIARWKGVEALAVDEEE